MNPLTLIIINMAIVVLLYVGGYQVNSGIITQGEVIALVNYMSQILVELVKLANLIITVTKAVACGNRIEQILEVESSMTDGTVNAADMKEKSDSAKAKEDFIVFDHVSMCYSGAKEPSL